MYKISDRVVFSRAHYVLILLVVVFRFTSHGQSVLWYETFENWATPSSGTRMPSDTFGCSATGAAPWSSYFKTTDGSLSGIALSGGSAWTGKEGQYYWGGEDTDGGGYASCGPARTAHKSITWSGINIANRTQLSFRGKLGCLNSPHVTNNWEIQGNGVSPVDYMIVEYRIDGGTWTSLLRFMGNGTRNLARETTGDSLGDGTVMPSKVLTEFVVPISGSGTTLDLRFKCHADGAGTEEVGIDNFRIYAAPTSEVCGNGVDDDGDGYADSFDPDCPSYAPIDCNGDFYQTSLISGIPFLSKATVNQGSLILSPIAPAPMGINAIGFDPVDRFIYGVNRFPPYQLYRINRTGASQLLGNLSGINSPFVVAGDFGPNGILYLRTSAFQMYSVNVGAGSLTATPIGPIGSVNINDFAYNPVDGFIYGFNTNLYRFNRITGAMTNLGASGAPLGQAGTTYFSPQGDLYAYSNVQQALARIKVSNSNVTIVATGQNYAESDGCSCALGIGLQKTVSTTQASSGQVFSYTFTLSNQSSGAVQNLQFKDTLQQGLLWNTNPYNMTNGLSISSGPLLGTNIASLTLQNIPLGVSSFKIDVLVPFQPCAPNVVLHNQAWISGGNVGNMPSDDPTEAQPNDPTEITLKFDTQPPSANCQATTANLDANGQASILPSDINLNSTDNCGIANLSASPSVFNCSQITSLPPVNIFISEYVEGSGNNQYIEIYNPLTTAVNLSLYEIRVFLNGASVPNSTLLSGTLAPGAARVFRNPLATIYAGASTSLTNMNWNGNDAIALYNINTNQYIDIFGRIGDAPPSAWTGTSNYTTLDRTLRRKSDILRGVANNPIGIGPTAFVTLNTEWDLFAMNTISGLGSHTVSPVVNSSVLTVTDFSGNTSTCTATVTVRDITSPTLQCPNSITQNNAPGTCSATVSFTPIASDNCSNILLSSSFPSGYAFPVGTTAVQVRASDLSSNVRTCTFNITVVDAQPPTISCPQSITQNAPSNSCSAIVAYSSPAANDNCPGVVLSQTAGLPSNSPFPVGITINTYRATAANGSTASCTFSVTVLESTPPIARCRDFFDTLNSNGSIIIVPADLDNGSTDNCGIGIQGVNPFSLDCSNLNRFPSTSSLIISEYVEGTANNQYIELYNGTSFNINLGDYQLRLFANGSPLGNPTVISGLSGTIAPKRTKVYRNAAATIYGGQSTSSGAINFNGDDAIVLWKTSTNTPVDIFGVIGSDPDGIPNPGNGWTATGYQTSNKTLRRKLTVANGIATNPSGNGPTAFTTLSSEWDVFNTNDVSGLGIHQYGPTNNITLTVADASGNSSTCSSRVTVVDANPPQLLCNPNTTRTNAPAQCSAPVLITQPTCTDNCSSLPVSMGNALSLDGVNDHVAIAGTWGGSTWSEATLEAWVRVNSSSTNPQAMIAANGNQFIHLQLAANIGSSIFTNNGQITLPTIPQTPLGTWNHVAIVAKSGASRVYVNGIQQGATNTAAFTSILTTNTIYLGKGLNNGRWFNGAIDEIRIWNRAKTQSEIASGMNLQLYGFQTGLIAYYQCNQGVAGGANQGITSLADQSGNNFQGSLVNLALAGTSSNFVAGQTITPPSPIALSNNFSGSNSFTAIFPVGNTAITWSASDAIGNSTTCTQMVTVQDIEPPHITCPPNVTVSNDPGQCGAVLHITSPTASDNCSTLSIVQIGGPANNSFVSEGAHHLTFKVLDAASLADTCSFYITVVDSEAPVANCPGPIAVQNLYGQCDQMVTFAYSFQDNCGIQTVHVSDSSGSSFPVGTSHVTVSVHDIHGLQDSCTFQIEVSDAEPPFSGVNSPPPALAIRNVPEAIKYNVLFQLDIPNFAQFQTPFDVPYNIDNSIVMGNIPFQRIAYYLELDTTWVWVSMDPFPSTLPDLGIPVDAILSESLYNMNVYSNCPSVTTGEGIQTGNIEFWSGCYNPGAWNQNIPTGNNNVYDYNDTPINLDCYGSFQIHNHGTASTIFAYNGWASGGISDLGIGMPNLSGVHPDWTFGANANQYVSKRLWVLVLDSGNVRCQNVITQLDIAGNSVVPINQLGPAFLDNCGIDTLFVTRDTFHCADLGAQTVTLTAVDAAGNSSSCMSAVFVEDTITPQLTCQNLVIEHPTLGNCSYSYSVPLWATDNCYLTCSTNPANGSALSLGLHNISYNAYDQSGNRSSCNYDLLVTDIEAPQATCNNITVAPTSTAGVLISPLDVVSSTSDNCGPYTMTLAPNYFDCVQNGQTILSMLVVTDSSGNSSQCSSFVSIQGMNCPQLKISDFTEINPKILDQDTLSSYLGSNFAISHSGPWSIIAFPNPVEQDANPYITLIILSPDDGYYQMELIDMYGQIFLYEELIAGTGENRYSIKCNPISSGTYLLRVSHNGTSKILRIMAL